MSEPMDTVRYFKLRNTGGFVARIAVLYKKKHTDEHGNISYDANWSEWNPSGYHDICAGAERTSDLKEIGLPEGSQVQLKAKVVAGKGKTSDTYEYSSVGGKMASYKISGTTLSNSLEREHYE